MKKYCLPLIILLFITVNAKSQLKTYINIEAGPAWDISRVQDPTKMFSQANLYGTIAGISIWQEIIGNLSIGSGAYYHTYSSAINPTDNRGHQAANESYSALLIPARISYRMQVSDFSFGLTPILGYQFGLLLNTPELFSHSSFISSPEEIPIIYSLEENASTINSLHLIEAGLAADYRFTNNWQLTFTFSHFSGLQDLKLSTLNYQAASASPGQAIYSNDGSRFQSTLSLDIPMSNLWENKDLRRHRKIESSSNRGAAVRRQNTIYFGGDIGALWRSFSTTNPAIGARPLTGKGIFRYSNLHTGTYFGYMFSSELGADIGINFQRSSTFFSLMYDYEVDYLIKERAPYFLEFPLMFRYFYNIYHDRIHLVPRLGFSVLTHFSGNEFNNGNGSFSTSQGNGTLNYLAGRSARFAYLLHAGIAVEYKIPIKFPMYGTCNLNYSHGLRDIDWIEIDTSFPETPEISNVNYNGTGWTVSLGVRIPFLLGKENRKCGAEQMKRQL